MSVPISDDQYRKYAPKRLREQPPEQAYVTLAPTIPSSMHGHEDRRTTSEFASRPEPAPEPPPPRRLKDWALAPIGRFAVVVTFAALVALLAIFVKPLWQGARTLLNANSQTLQTPANSPLVPAIGIAAGSGPELSASAQAQQAPPDSQTLQASKPSDRLTANNTPANSPLVPAIGIVAAGSGPEPSASAQAQSSRPRTAPTRTR